MNDPSHSGRNAFRRVSGRELMKDFESMNMDEMRRQQFAMRSFTDSVEVDDLPLPPESSHLERRLTATSEEGWPDEADWLPQGDCSGMTTSSTNNTIDTIIEMKPREENQQLGETQKYVMSVPGPGHAEQELELHKSLLRESAETPGTTSSDEMECLASVQALMQFRSSASMDFADSIKSSSRTKEDLFDHICLRQEFNRVATQRPRPTTPTSWSALENYVVEGDKGSRNVEAAFVPISERMPPDCGAKIKVALPGQKDGSPHSGSLRGRQSSMSWSDFYDTMAGQQCSDIINKDQDLLETNPAYAHKAPPKPVVHRRSSVDWENFEETSANFVDNPVVLENHSSSQMYSNNGQPDQSASNPFVLQQNDPIAPTRAAPPPPPGAQPACSWQEEETSATDQSNSYYSSTTYSNIYSGYDQDTPTRDYPPYDQSSQVVPSDDVYSQQPDVYSQQPDVYSQQPDVYSQQPDVYSQQPDVYSQQPDVYSQQREDYSQYADAVYNPYAQYGVQSTDYDQPAETYSSQPEVSQYNHTNYTTGYEGYADSYSGYQQAPQVDITGTDAYGTSFEYGQDYSRPAAVSTAFLSQPILPPQRSRTPDPFSWEVQESAYEKHGSAVAPPPRPAPPLTPSRMTPEPSWAELSSSVAVQLSPSGEEQMSSTTGSSKSPPPRPGAAPPRPVAPSPSPMRPPPPSLTGSPFVERRAAEQAAAQKKQEAEEDPWAKFKQMTEQVSSVVSKTTEQLNKLSEKSAADDIKDESYVATIGGNQGFQLNSAQKQILQIQADQKKQKADKKKRGKRPPSPTYDPNREQDLEKAAAELVRKMQNTRADLADWKPPSDTKIDALSTEQTPSPELLEEQKERKESVKEVEESAEKFADFSTPAMEDPTHIPNNWAGFGDDSGPVLPSSDSDFFQKALAEKVKANGLDGKDTGEDPFGSAPDAVDPFAPMTQPSLINESYDPFDTRPAGEVIAKAKQRAELEKVKIETDRDLELYAGSPTTKAALNASRLSSPTPEGGSPATGTGDRPTGFEDDFKAEAGQSSHTPTPLYDEDDSAPLGEFPEKFVGEGWELLIRYPPKKKIMADRYWKPCYVRIQGNSLLLFGDKKESKPFQEILLQASYSLSDVSLQAYDVYGKIHTAKHLSSLLNQLFFLIYIPAMNRRRKQSNPSRLAAEEDVQLPTTSQSPCNGSTTNRAEPHEISSECCATQPKTKKFSDFSISALSNGNSKNSSSHKLFHPAGQTSPFSSIDFSAAQKAYETLLEGMELDKKEGKNSSNSLSMAAALFSSSFNAVHPFGFEQINPLLSLSKQVDGLKGRSVGRGAAAKADWMGAKGSARNISLPIANGYDKSKSSQNRKRPASTSTNGIDLPSTSSKASTETDFALDLSVKKSPSNHLKEVHSTKRSSPPCISSKSTAYLSPRCSPTTSKSQEKNSVDALHKLSSLVTKAGARSEPFFTKPSTTDMALSWFSTFEDKLDQADASSVDPSSIFTCLQCFDRFQSMEGLVKHMEKTRHFNAPPPFSSKTSGGGTSNGRSTTASPSSHKPAEGSNNVKSYNPLSVVSKESVKNGQSNGKSSKHHHHHQQHGTFSFKCIICGHSSSENSINEHMTKSHSFTSPNEWISAVKLIPL